MGRTYSTRAPGKGGSAPGGVEQEVLRFHHATPVMHRLKHMNCLHLDIFLKYFWIVVDRE